MLATVPHAECTPGNINPRHHPQGFTGPMQCSDIALHPSLLIHQSSSFFSAQHPELCMTLPS
jgi:hypothetical protein